MVADVSNFLLLRPNRILKTNMAYGSALLVKKHW